MVEIINVWAMMGQIWMSNDRSNVMGQIYTGNDVEVKYQVE